MPFLFNIIRSKAYNNNNNNNNYYYNNLCINLIIILICFAVYFCHYRSTVIFLRYIHLLLNDISIRNESYVTM
jgi:hypothetical protein